MVLPIIVTIPFGDSEKKEEDCKERQDYENKLIDAISKDEYIGLEEEPFYSYWYFYPYKNPYPRGQPLSPSQLCNVLKDEFDLFVLLSKIDSKENFERTFQKDSCTIVDREVRLPIMPAHNNKRAGEVVISKEEKVEWENRRIVLVADDLNCEWIKFFQVSTFDLFRRKAREFRRAGIKLDLREDDERLQSDDRASDVEEVDGSHSLNHNDDEMDMITNKRFKIRTDYTFDGNSAASWLNLPSEKYCAINGINATYMPTDMVTYGNNQYCQSRLRKYGFQ